MLYVNGIAWPSLELKRSSVGGRRHPSDPGNQKTDFIQPFFSTVQLVMAGNDTEGLRYAVIETREKYWLDGWFQTLTRIGARRSTLRPPVLRRARSGNSCPGDKHRLLELSHDFIVFDAGVKKMPPNQYFGVKAGTGHASTGAKAASSGTPKAPGKSLTMVWLAKWIRENIRRARADPSRTAPNSTSRSRGCSTGSTSRSTAPSSGADLIDTSTRRPGADLLAGPQVRRPDRTRRREGLR